MEGDLLEVSLDETQELWRILETMPPTLLQAEAMERVVQYMQRQRQQHTNPLPTSGAEDSNDSLMVQNSPNSNSNSGGATGSASNSGRNKKRRSNDTGGNSAVPRKKQSTPKQTPGKKGSAAAARKSDAKASPAASTTPVRMPMPRISRPTAVIRTPVQDQVVAILRRRRPHPARRTKSESAPQPQPPIITTTIIITARTIATAVPI